MSKYKNTLPHDVIKAIAEDCCLHYARSDIKSLIDFNGRNMIDHLMNTIGNNYRNNHDRNMRVASSTLRKIVSHKAHQILIELGTEWIENLRAVEHDLAADLPGIRDTHSG